MTTPVIRSSHFGDWYDFGVAGAIVVAIDDHGYRPVRLLLSHQLYVETAKAILAAHPGARELVVLPVGEATWIPVPLWEAAVEP